MQQPQQMIPIMPSYPPTNITTEQIQKFLDENKKLILAILDNQNLGKLAECAQYQALLQKNLMYLAAIADAQPQAPTMPAQVHSRLQTVIFLPLWTLLAYLCISTWQMAPHPAMQPGGFYMQHAQAAAMAQQPGIFPQKVPLQFNNPHQLQEHQQQQQLHQHHQQAIQGQMDMRPGGANNGMHPLHTEGTLGGGSSTVPTPSAGRSDIRGGNKQDASEAGADGLGSSGTRRTRGDGDSSGMNGAEDPK